MDKRLIPAFVAALVPAAMIFAPAPVGAQAVQEPTQIVLGAPGFSTLGEPVVVQAVLADSQGRPIARAVIYFTARVSFLGRKDDVVFAQAVTNGNGQAVAQFVADFTGDLALRAEFRGDAQYQPSQAALDLPPAAGSQVYVEHIGVDLPGFNVPPVTPAFAGLQSQGDIGKFVAGLWPAMNGWPVAAALLLVWATYFSAARFVFRLAALADEPAQELSEPGRDEL